MFMMESTMDVKPEEMNSVKSSMQFLQPEVKEPEKQLETKEPKVEQNNASVQKPVDLYKVLPIFSSEDVILLVSANIHTTLEHTHTPKLLNTSPSTSRSFIGPVHNEWYQLHT